MKNDNFNKHRRSELKTNDHFTVITLKCKLKGYFFYGLKEG